MCVNFIIDGLELVIGSCEGDGGCFRCCFVVMVWVIWVDLVDGCFLNDIGSVGELFGFEVMNWNVGSDVGLLCFVLVFFFNVWLGLVSKIWLILLE